MKKTVFEYDNYRDYLRDFYVFAKAQNKKFSYRYFARVAGIGSPSFLKHVIDGERNLTEPVIQKFVHALKLTKQEADFFASLVLLNQAKSNEEKELYAQELLGNKRFTKFHLLSAAQLSYYESWYHVAIREMVTIKGFKEDPEWIASRIQPAITAFEAKKALTTLKTIGLLKYDESGRLVQTETLISTGNEVMSAFVARFHKEMIKQGSDAIERFPKPKREISAATFAVSEETFKVIKEKIQKFRKEIQELASNDPHHDFVCQLNVQLFPLSEPEGEET
jgi:uncharacterized protein (TIGR02147 family)